MRGVQFLVVLLAVVVAVFVHTISDVESSSMHQGHDSRRPVSQLLDPGARAEVRVRPVCVNE